VSARGPRPGPRSIGVLFGAVLSLVAAVVLAGCGAGPAAGSTTAGTSTAGTTTTLVPRAGGSVIVGTDQEIQGCNPHLDVAGASAIASALAPVLPSAFVAEPGGGLVLDQAVVLQAEPVNLHPETIVYTLNPRATWSDGVPITAADFIYAWKMQRGSGEAPGAATGIAPDVSTLGYRDIRSITGSHGGRTVTVVFKSLFSDWQMLFGELLPAHVLEKVGYDVHCDALDPAVDLSGGPFRVISATPTHVVYGRNLRWWGRAPALNGLAIRVGTNSTQLAAWLAAGQIQVAQPTTFDAGFLQTVTGTANLRSDLEVGDTFLSLQFDTTASELSSTDVRLALAHAVDRQSLADAVVGFATFPATPATSHLYAQAQSQYPAVPVGGQPPFPDAADVSEATTLLNEAGMVQNGVGQWILPSGRPFTLRLGVDAADGWALRTAHLIAVQLDRFGVPVTVVTEPSTTAAGAALAAGSVTMAVLAMHASPFPTQALAWYTQSLGPAGQNGSEDWSGFNNPTVTSLLTQAAANLNPSSAAPVYSHVDQLLWQAMPTLPLFTLPAVLAQRDTVGGVSLNPDGSTMYYTQSWSLLVPSTSSSGASGS